jgi:hypothetical protein
MSISTDLGFIKRGLFMLSALFTTSRRRVRFLNDVFSMPYVEKLKNTINPSNGRDISEKVEANEAPVECNIRLTREAWQV